MHTGAQGVRSAETEAAEFRPHNPHPSENPPTPPHPHLPPQFHPGSDVGRGNDDTLFALKEGVVVFKTTKYVRSVSVIDVEAYEIPEGQRRQPGSRREKRLAKYTPRAQQRAAAAAAVVAATVAP